MTIGRNDPCHCGSGKKFKKCCIGLENFETLKMPTPQPPKCISGNLLVDSIIEKKELESNFEKITTISPHNIFRGLREYVLDSLYQLYQHLNLKRRNDDYIKYLVSNLLKILKTNGKSYILFIEMEAKTYSFSSTAVDEVISIAEKSIDTDLSRMEKFLLTDVLTSIVMEFEIETQFSYDTVRITIELTYRALRDKVLPDSCVGRIIIDIAPVDVLLGWSNGSVNPYPDDFDPLKRKAFFQFWKERKSCPKKLKNIAQWLSLGKRQLSRHLYNQFPS